MEIQRVMVTGHRPNKLGGWRTPNPVEQWVRATLDTVLLRLAARKPVLAISGMALGADQMFAEAALNLGIPFLAAVPFQGQESVWPPHSQERYLSLMERASEIVYVDQQEGYLCPPLATPEKVAVRKLNNRNTWMVDHSDVAVAVWDGSSGGTGNCVRYLFEQQRKVLVIDPVRQTVGMRAT